LLPGNYTENRKKKGEQREGGGQQIKKRQNKCVRDPLTLQERGGGEKMLKERLLLERETHTRTHTHTHVKRRVKGVKEENVLGDVETRDA
jgi:hypothetical protein